MLLIFVHTVWRETLVGGNVGKFGELSVICQTNIKPSKLILIINNLLADLLIRQAIFHQMVKTSQLANVSPAKVSLHTVDLRGR